MEELPAIVGDAKTLGEFITYETDDYTISKAGLTSDGTVCFSAPGEEELGVVYFLSYAGASGTAYHRTEGRAAQSSLVASCESKGIEVVTDQFERENTIIFSVCAADCPLVSKNLPITLREFRSPNEFFNNQDRQEAYLAFLNRCDYQGLLDYLRSFSDNTNIESNDVVNLLMDYCNQIIPLMDNCSISFDPFESVANIVYLGVEDIDYNICVVPIMTTGSTFSGATVDYKLGFIKDDWLFFNSIIAIAGDERGEMRVKSYNVTRDVLGAGQISEYVFEDATSFVKAITEAGEIQSGSIRFENTDSHKTYDHEFTDQELSAIYTIEQIELLHSKLYRALDTWESK